MTNLDFRHVDATQRIHVDLGKLKFGVLHQFFEDGEDYVAKLEALKGATKGGHFKEVSGAVKRLAGDKFKDSSFVAEGRPATFWGRGRLVGRKDATVKEVLA